MSKINSFKNKIADKFGNETIGEVEGLEQIIEESVPEPPKKKKKTTKKKVKKEEKEANFFKKKVKEVKENPTNKRQKKTRKEENRFLKIHNIDDTTDIEGLITPEEIKNVQFTLIAPTGLDPHEVQKVISKIQRDIGKYIETIRQRDTEVQVLAEENTRLESILQDEQQKSEMASLFNSQQDREDQLRNQLADLQMENMELKQKLERLEKNRQDTVLPKEITRTEVASRTKQNEQTLDDNVKSDDDIFNSILGDL